MKVAIVGYGIEGQSALPYWQKRGAEVTVCDRNEETQVPHGVEAQLGASYLNDLGRFDVIMRTAGMHPKVILEQSPGVEGKITTTVDEFLRTSPTKNIIGVTGTKGKGTTCMLTVKMLEAAGKKTFLGGNFGVSPFEFYDQLTPDSWVVLELSSFMLYDIRHSPHIGVCLMVQPEHLDWHGDFTDYSRSKANLFRWQNEQDVAIYYAESVASHKIASTSPGRKIAFYDEPGAYIHDNKVMIDQTVLCDVSELKLLGTHNWQNVCAAVTAVWQVGQVQDAIRQVLTTFSGLPNRLEMVREFEGVRYYNDSFASDPYATEAAIAAIPRTKVVIVGGFERMLPLEQFALTVKQHDKDIRTLILIGASAKRVATALQANGFDKFKLSPAKTMADIVAEAHAHAEEGDAVLLSPGFASFDMFKNFDDRGRQFKEAVHKL